ncbi:MAG TPA: thiamine pyrophosphate-binding protein [Bryobacteraceae bacterium]|jgi:thiamine pyrophosphate-dependent acetolactate synthase large subunit-like protein|nr:thiamine pyrophosphate-binding protein [Bryobacteraceae bacterium]
MATEETTTTAAAPIASVIPQNASQAIAGFLTALGVRYAFGVSGGAIAAIWGALSSSEIEVVHFRHESGAAFAAVEAHFATGAPVVVFTTTGPGLTNALTGMLAARGEGAKIILISACTTASNRGRWAIQETDGDFLPVGLTAPGALFHMAAVVESVEALPQIARRVANGLARPGGFVCHLSIPTGLQAVAIKNPMPSIPVPVPALDAPPESIIDECVALLTKAPLALWLGYGARTAGNGIKMLAERLGAPVMCSPRAKGIFPENHPLFVGVTGMGGHDAVQAYMKQSAPRRILVLGTRLGEPTSFWNPAMIPAEGFIHVDIDADVPGVAYPEAFTLPVRADVGEFVAAVLRKLPRVTTPSAPHDLPHPFRPHLKPSSTTKIRPELVMQAVQHVAIERHDCLIMAESGNSFTWATHYLRFTKAGRYRVSTGVGSMAHFATGVVGAAIAGERTAVAIVGDGAMLMSNEISTAVKKGAPAVWIVLNDGRYNMCEQGMSVLGLEADARIPPVDFAMFARALGAGSEIVESEMHLNDALELAISARNPFVLDVRIDPACLAPSMARNRGLRAQGIGTPSSAEDISFPKTR